MVELLAPTHAGLHCVAGGFHVDPADPVPLAVITHAHADHARPGSALYVCTREAAPIVAHRIPDAAIRAVEYGERITLGDVSVSLHPAGHVLGSAQVRIERDGEVWVASGDFKRAPDPTCVAFESVRCDVFVSEATFALPIYRWPAPSDVAAEILAWWRACAARGRTALLFCYALGKSQRILAELSRLIGDAPADDAPVYVHGAIEPIVALYRSAGVAMLPTQLVRDVDDARKLRGALVLAPPSASGTPWMKRFSAAETALASGFMRVRGDRRRRGHDRGFVLSDHADWPALLDTVAESGAKRVLVTHGHSEVLARFLRERGLDATPIVTNFEGEGDA